MVEVYIERDSTDFENIRRTVLCVLCSCCLHVLGIQNIHSCLFCSRTFTYLHVLRDIFYGQADAHGMLIQWATMMNTTARKIRGVIDLEQVLRIMALQLEPRVGMQSTFANCVCVLLHVFDEDPLHL